MTEREEITTKICLVGDSAVGKTSLIKRYVFDEFDDRYIFTLGAKITKREMVLKYPELELEVDVKVLIFDIIGEIGFRRLLREAYYAVTNQLDFSGSRNESAKNSGAYISKNMPNTTMA